MVWRHLTLASMFLLTLLQPASAEPDALAPRLKQLQQWLDEQAGAFHIPDLTAAVFDSDQPIEVLAAGSDARVDLPILIGSCTKSVTALATLLVADRHGIDLDTAVSEILPQLRFASSENVTLRQLLQHRSGLARVQGFQALPTLDVLQNKRHTIELAHKPGSRYEYSNLNYAILGLVIEQVSGMGFCDYVRKHIFVPLSMTHSSCISDANAAKAIEYQFFFGHPVRVDAPSPHITQIPSGFIRTTAKDFAIFMRCIMEEGRADGQQVFPAPLIRLMKSPPNEGGLGYGMGLSVHPWGEDRHLIGHEGATPTSYSVAAFVPETQQGLVLLANVNLFDPFTDQGEAIYRGALEILEAREPTPVRPYAIWLRWILLAACILLLVDTMRGVVSAKRAGLRFALPLNKKRWIDVAASCLIPLGIWYVVLHHWAKTPFSMAFRSQPDIVGALVFLTVLGAIRSLLRSCVYSPREPTASLPPSAPATPE